MISYNYQTDFRLEDEHLISEWLLALIKEEKRKAGDINYIFCSDEYLHKLNVDYLHHDTLTDIISFDYTVGNELHGDIYISIDRVIDNAKDYSVHFIDELSRVMAHGLLHYCGYKDKSNVEQTIMRGKEDYYLAKR